jgi:DNA repair protein RadD
MIPRDYQIEAVNSVPRYFETNDGNPVLAMPTGTGKSVVIACLLKLVFQYPGQRVMVATHVKELIQQNYEKLMIAWPQAPAGIYSAGLGRKDKFHPIIFAGIASVAKRASEFGKIDLLIIDEAHLVSPSEETNYQKFIRDARKINSMMKVIGLTATPWRLGHGRITEGGGIFTDLCFDITGLHPFNRLIKEGYLCPLVPKQTKLELDTKDVGIRGGEFKSDELQLAVDKQEITYAALKEAIEHGGDRRSWLIFAAGVEHAIHISDMLNHLGISCRAVHSKSKTRDQDIEEWKAGKIRALSNNNVLTTGIDHPMLDFIVMLRPTASPVLWVQMLGRGTRTDYVPGYDLQTVEGRVASIQASFKQNCLVLDFAGNTRRLGPINDPVIPRQKGKGPAGEAPVKLCMACGTYNHASARECFLCGSEFPIQTKLKQSADTAALIKDDIPITEVFQVDQITYSRHSKAGRPDSLKLTYYCKLRSFHEWVPIEATGSIRGIAHRWWKARVDFAPPPGMPMMPPTVDEVLAIASKIPPATHIRVWTNKQYPEIIAYCFDGSNFGTQAPTPVQVTQNSSSGNIFKKPWEQEVERLVSTDSYLTDDDIPF